MVVVVVVLLMLDLLGTDKGRVGLVGYFRGIPIVVPRAILDDELPIILFFLLFFSSLLFFSHGLLLLLFVVAHKWIDYLGGWFPLCSF